MIFCNIFIKHDNPIVVRHSFDWADWLLQDVLLTTNQKERGIYCLLISNVTVLIHSLVAADHHINGFDHCFIYLLVYHWWELPQVLFLSRQKFCHNKHKDVFIMTKHIFCHDKSMLVTTKLLSRHIFVATNMCLSQQRFCLDKHTFVTTKDVFCCDKQLLVVTKVCLLQQISVMTKLSWQKYFVVTNIIFSWQNFCHNKHTFVVTRDNFFATKHLSQQAYFCCDKRCVFTCLSKQKFCRDKNYTCGSSCQWYLSFLHQFEWEAEVAGEGMRAWGGLLCQMETCNQVYCNVLLSHFMVVIFLYVLVLAMCVSRLCVYATKELFFWVNFYLYRIFTIPVLYSVSL